MGTSLAKTSTHCIGSPIGHQYHLVYRASQEFVETDSDITILVSVSSLTFLFHIQGNAITLTSCNNAPFQLGVELISVVP